MAKNGSNLQLLSITFQISYELQLLKITLYTKTLLNELFLCFWPLQKHISFAVLVECDMKQMRIGTSHASTCIFINKNRITILLQTQTVCYFYYSFLSKLFILVHLLIKDLAL